MPAPSTLVLPVAMDPDDPIGSFERLLDYYEAHPEFVRGLDELTVGNPISLRNIANQGAVMAQKLVERAGASAGDYAQGVKNPRRDPIAAAKAGNGKYKANTTKAIQEDAYLKAQDKRNLDEEIENATSDGGAAYAAGISKRRNKITRVFNELAPAFDALSKSIQNMPKDNDQQNEARMLAARRGMITIGRRRKGLS